MARLRTAQLAATGSTVSGQPRIDSGTTNFSVRFGGMICTESDFGASQVELPTTCAVADCFGASWTRLTRMLLRAAGWPSATPALISCTPGNPVSEQVLVELLVNCRKAYWCPAAPEPRSATTPSEALGHPVAPAGGGLAGAGAVLLGAGAAEDEDEDAAVGEAELVAADALALTELAVADAVADAVLLAGVAEATGSVAVFGAGVQDAVSASAAASTASRGSLPRGVVLRGVVVRREAVMAVS